MRVEERDNRMPPASFAETVLARLHALRAEHPDAQVTTELVRLDETVAIVRAAIVLPNGGSASGFGSAGSGGQDAVEDAETRALNRALTVLGFAPAISQPAREVPVAEPGPAREKAQPEEPGREPVSPTPEPEPEEPEATPVRQPVPAREPTRPEPIRREPTRLEPVRSTPTPLRPTQVADLEDDPPLADYSWTEFWKWARTLGYGNKQVVEELIGESITSLSPAQVRVLLREKTGAE